LLKSLILEQKATKRNQQKNANSIKPQSSPLAPRGESWREGVLARKTNSEAHTNWRKVGAPTDPPQLTYFSVISDLTEITE
jgi:hypothetical protein